MYSFYLLGHGDGYEKPWWYRMKKKAVVKSIVFDKDIWDKIIKRVGEIEDSTNKETTISKVVNDLCELGLSKNPGGIV